MMDKHDETPLTERDILIRGAAEALMSEQETAKSMAGCKTARFVQTARPIYKSIGFDFTDTDLRDIHEMLRELVVRKLLGGNSKALILQ